MCCFVRTSCCLSVTLAVLNVDNFNFLCSGVNRKISSLKAKSTQYIIYYICRFEIIAVAEGSSNITGLVSQIRTTYSNTDILWGQRFKSCVDFHEEQNAYIVDYKKFKQTQPFDTPLCSAKKLADIQKNIVPSEANTNFSVDIKR